MKSFGCMSIPVCRERAAVPFLSQTWSPPLPGDDLDDAWDELAPDPGERRRSVMELLIGTISLGLLVLTLISVILSLMDRS